MRKQKPPICLVDGCSGKTVARGYCWKHYQQNRRHGRLTPEREHVFGLTSCKVEGCKRRHYARGYCENHYMQWRYARKKAQRAAQEGGVGEDLQ